MNKKHYLFASSWAVLALALVTLFSFAACSSGSENDELPDPAEELAGTWVRTYTRNDGFKVVEKYHFYKGGSAEYSNNTGVAASITYKLGVNEIYGEIVYIYREEHSIYRSDFKWTYFVSGDVLRIKKSTEYHQYTREK